jgi:hypothetical protein
MKQINYSHLIFDLCLLKKLMQINLNITAEQKKSDNVINQITNQNSQNMQLLNELNTVIDKLKLNISDLKDSLEISVRYFCF